MLKAESGNREATEEKLKAGNGQLGATCLGEAPAGAALSMSIPSTVIQAWVELGESRGTAELRAKCSNAFVPGDHLQCRDELLLITSAG